MGMLVGWDVGWKLDELIGRKLFEALGCDDVNEDVQVGCILRRRDGSAEG